jgi:hypothetical protein
MPALEAPVAINSNTSGSGGVKASSGSELRCRFSIVETIVGSSQRRNELLDLANPFLQQIADSFRRIGEPLHCQPHFDVLGEDQYPTPGLLTDRHGGSHSFTGVSGRQSDIDDDRIGRVVGYPCQ